MGIVVGTSGWLRIHHAPVRVVDDEPLARAEQIAKRRAAGSASETVITPTVSQKSVRGRSLRVPPDL
jgi:hypothetical protein